MNISIPYGDNLLIELEVVVVDVDVPYLLGLPTLDKHAICIDDVREVKVCTNPKLELPISRKGGHKFYEWDY